MSTCNLYMTVLIDMTFMAEMLPEALKLLQFNILNGKQNEKFTGCHPNTNNR